MKKRGLILIVSMVVAFGAMPVSNKVSAEIEEAGTEQEVLLDTVKPVIKGVKSHCVFVNEKINYLRGVTALDNVDGNLTKKIKVNRSKINLKKAGKYVVTYSVSDKAGNTAIKKATIRVKKDKAPVLKGVRNQTIYLNNPISYRKGVTAIDDKDGNLTKRIKVDSSKVNKSRVGKYPVIYSIKDSAGNKTVKKTYITVKKFKLFTPKQSEGKDVDGDVPASGKHVGTW